jgi:hypothetical protein
MYELAIGGHKGDASATIYDELTDLNISENPTALGGWDATVPYTLEHEDSLLADVVIYYNDAVIFEGMLESVESSFDDSSTKLSGRGTIVELEYQTDSITYSNTTVFDAIRDYWLNRTGFDGSILPPNRDYYDSEHVSTAGLRRLFNEDNDATHRNYESHFQIQDSQLSLNQLNFTEDVVTSASTIATDGVDTQDSDYSQQTAVRLDGDTGSYVDYSYSVPDDPDYENSDYRWYVRLQSSNIADATLDCYINGTHVRTWSVSSTTLSHQWLDVLNDARLSSVNTAPSSITSDPTFRIEVSGLDSDEWIDVDAQAVTDETFGSYTLPGSTNADGVYTGPEWYPNTVLVDGEATNVGDILPSTPTDRLGVVVETQETIAEFTAELIDKDSGEVVTDTHTHVRESSKHYFDFQFSQTGTDFALRLRLDGQVPDTQTASGETSTPAVSRIEVFAPDESQFVTIEEAEFNGTKFEILKSLHERGTYRFAVRDYENDVVETFPRDTLNDEPFWTINSEQRKLDYADYANSVTVHGKTADDGTYNSKTVSNQDEIDAIGRAVEAFEKNLEVATQQEVDTRAQRLLEEKVAETDEAGSMDVVPQRIDVGYTYPISPWSDAFRYGGRIGVNALDFRGDDGAPDSVEFDDDDAGPATDRYTFEFLLHPRGLKAMPDDDYVGICGLSNTDATPNYNDLVTLYGDGSLGIGYGQQDNSDPYRARTESGIIHETETQRLSIVFGPYMDTWRVYVDGQLKAQVQPENASKGFEIDTDGGTFHLGVDAKRTNPYDGGLDDVRLFYEERTQAQIEEYAYEDLMESTTADLSRLPFYLRFDDRSDTTTALMDSGTAYVPPDGTITGATYEASYGRLEELQYSLGADGNLSLNFDIAGRVDTELAKTRDAVRSNRRNL